LSPENAPAGVDIIVPVYKSVALTTRCLNSLATHLHEISDRAVRLMVINDSPGETDVRQMLEAFAHRCPAVMLLENERNLGFVGTVNRGLVLACKDGRDVILVNADTETFPGTIRNLLSTADADPQIGFVSPRSNNASFCSLPHFYGGVLASQEEAHRRWQILSRTLPPFHFVPTAVGFYLYIKHEVIANFGLLDPGFGIGYEEENDLVLRANKVGYRAVLANHAFAYHAGSASFNLLDMNLKAHREANLQKMAQRHPEYLPLIRRYEGSAHFRAERLLGNVLPSGSGRPRIVFDLSTVGAHYNGTNEMGMAIIRAFHERHASRFEIHVVCTPEVYKFHQLDRCQDLQRHEVELQSVERFAIGVQLGQPFTVHALSQLEDLAAINVFGMLDTIADDCGYLSITHQLESLWGHVARHADGLFFNSRFSESAFVTRYPDAKQLPRYPRLLPTRLSSYKKASGRDAADHVLILGNHFAHKASDPTAEVLRAAFPTIQFVVLGAQNRLSNNVRALRAGTLDEQQMEALYTRASIIVLPSYVEGFGMGLVHALAAGKVVVCRDIPATREILATYHRHSGVFLYQNDNDLVRILSQALREGASRVEDRGTESWNEWADGFADFCSSLLERTDIFERLVRRIQSGDLLRKAQLLERLQSLTPAVVPSIQQAANLQVAAAETPLEDEQGRKWPPVHKVKRLLALDGEAFVYGCYVTILKRLPDSEGLMNYLTELQSGIGKLEIISRLRRSTEGQRANALLRGYRREMLRSHCADLFGIVTSNRHRAS
jgi:GT2 family glycosyltransferase